MGGWGGWTNERPKTDLVTSGPMRGLEKKCTRWRRQTDRQTDIQTDRQTNKQTDRHSDSMTESAQWGQFSENELLYNNQYENILMRGTRILK